MSALLAKIRAAMPATGTRRIGPIGLEFARNAVHAVQFRRDGDALTMLAQGSLPYEGMRDELLAEGGRAGALVRDLVRSSSFRGNALVSVVPSSELRIIPVNYVLKPGQSEAQVILGLMQERLPEGLNDHVVDFVPVRAAGPDSERVSLVAVAQQAPLIRYLEMFRKAGFRMNALEIGPVAIRRCVTTMLPEQEDANVAILNCGQTKSYLTLISGRRLLFDQAIDHGEDSLLSAVSRTLDLPLHVARMTVHRHGVDPKTCVAGADPDTAGTLRDIVKPPVLRVVDEIRRALAYAASSTRGGPVRNMYLLGSLARWPGAATFLTSLAGLPVEVFPDPRSVYEMEDAGEQQQLATAPDLIVATGLAMRGLVDD